MTVQTPLDRRTELQVVTYEEADRRVVCRDCGTDVTASKGGHPLPSDLRVHGWACSACQNTFPANCHGPDAPSYNDRITGVKVEFRDGETRYVPAIASSVADKIDADSELYDQHE
jgi:hypothetical protein